MEDIGESFIGGISKEVKVDVGRLRNTVANEFGHVFALKDSDSLNNRLEGMVIGLGKEEENINSLQAKGENVSPLDAARFKLNKTLSFWVARSNGWTEADIEESIERGKAYAKREHELEDLTGETGFEIWAKKKIMPQIRRES